MRLACLQVSLVSRDELSHNVWQNSWCRSSRGIRVGHILSKRSYQLFFLFLSHMLNPVHAFPGLLNPRVSTFGYVWWAAVLMINNNPRDFCIMPNDDSLCVASIGVRLNANRVLSDHFIRFPLSMWVELMISFLLGRGSVDALNPFLKVVPLMVNMHASLAN